MKQMTLRQNSLFIGASELVEHLLTCYEHGLFVCLLFVLWGEEVWDSGWENLIPFKAFLGSKQNTAVVEWL